MCTRFWPFRFFFVVFGRIDLLRAELRGLQQSTSNGNDSETALLGKDNSDLKARYGNYEHLMLCSCSTFHVLLALIVNIQRMVVTHSGGVYLR